MIDRKAFIVTEKQTTLSICVIAAGELHFSVSIIILATNRTAKLGVSKISDWNEVYKSQVSLKWQPHEKDHNPGNVFIKETAFK